MKLTKKIYSSKTGDVSFVYSILIDGVITNHVFTLESNNTREVVDPVHQKAIEESKYFKKGWIIVSKELDPTPADVYRYEKSKKREEKIVSIVKNTSDEKKAKAIQEHSQIGIRPGENKTELEKAIEEIENDKDWDEELNSGEEMKVEDVIEMMSDPEIVVEEESIPEAEAVVDAEVAPEAEVIEEVKEVVAEDVQNKTFPEVTNYQEAKDLLRKTFEVPFQKVSNPAAINKKAEELGISFPNLK
jgi:flagellar biosynthesis GTPase FlhF